MLERRSRPGACCVCLLLLLLGLLGSRTSIFCNGVLHDTPNIALDIRCCAFFSVVLVASGAKFLLSLVYSIY